MKFGIPIPTQQINIEEIMEEVEMLNVVLTLSKINNILVQLNKDRIIYWGGSKDY